MKPKTLLYEERVTSPWTGLLFLALTLLFAFLLILRQDTRGWDWLAAAFLAFALIFLFYTINYRRLVIRITPDGLILTFGVFRYTVSFEDISRCLLDNHFPALLKYGGAGIHFMTVNKRYRISFNFLEHPRLVIELKKNRGWVQDVSFSTRQPDEIITIITARASL